MEELLKQFNAPDGAVLEKQFKNGNIQIRVKAVCDRCYNRKGIYYVGVHNGVPVPSHLNNGLCFKCNGAGYVWEKHILMTPENRVKRDRQLLAQAEKMAKMDEERQAEAKRFELEAEEKRQEELKAQREEEERIKALKSISQYVGAVGDKLVLKCTLVGSPYWEQKSYTGYGTVTMYAHTFKDDLGNKLVWKTTKGLPMDIDTVVTLKGTIKDHSEYNDEKQTLLTRCKITAV